MNAMDPHLHVVGASQERCKVVSFFLAVLTLGAASPEPSGVADGGRTCWKPQRLRLIGAALGRCLRRWDRLTRAVTFRREYTHGQERSIVGEDIGAAELWLAVVVFAATLIIAAVIRLVAVHLLDRGDADRRVGRLTGRFLSVVVVVVGLVYALGILNIQIGPLLGALGVGGIALAFAAQDILQNFVAGLLLQLRRPFRIRDQISSGDFEGNVVDVNLRTVEMVTYDGLTVYLPNAEVLKAPIVNFTRTPLNRTSIDVGLAYDTDLPKAREVLLSACQKAEGVAEAPGVEVWVQSFGDSSINCAVRYWHASDIASRWRVRNAVAIAVKQGLDEAGMVIAFPQRTLWFGPGNTTLGLHQLSAGDDATTEPGI